MPVESNIQEKRNRLEPSGSILLAFPRPFLLSAPRSLIANIHGWNVSPSLNVAVNSCPTLMGCFPNVSSFPEVLTYICIWHCICFLLPSVSRAMLLSLVVELVVVVAAAAKTKALSNWQFCFHMLKCHLFQYFYSLVSVWQNPQLQRNCVSSMCTGYNV